jgi:hypothetical protein
MLAFVQVGISQCAFRNSASAIEQIAFMLKSFLFSASPFGSRMLAAHVFDRKRLAST